MVLSKSCIVKLFLARKNVLSAFPDDFNNDTMRFSKFQQALTKMGDNLNMNDANIKAMMNYLVCTSRDITLVFMPLFGKHLDKKYITQHFQYAKSEENVVAQSNFCTVHTTNLYIFTEDVGPITHKKVVQNDGTVLDIRVLPLSDYYVNTGKLWHSAKFKPIYQLEGKEKEFDRKYKLPQISSRDDPALHRLQLAGPVIAVRVTQKSATNYFRNHVRKVVD